MRMRRPFLDLAIILTLSCGVNAGRGTAKFVLKDPY
jgi:hypothetical protein